MFNQVDIKQKQRFFVRRMIALGILGTLSLGVLLGLAQCWHHRLFLSAQTKVISSAKFTIKPVKWISSDQAVFHVEIESFQNPPILDMDLAKTTLLVDEDDNPYKPKFWQHKPPYKGRVAGDLVFTVGENKPKKLVLIVFSGDETQFVWSLR